jgi:prepilin-type N-terminal cleavage/methylation domain-containing protein
MAVQGVQFRGAEGVAEQLRAFTLMELLLVMAIITLMVALAAPRLSAFAAGQKADEMARTVVSLARYGSSQAVSDGRAYRLNVDAASREVWLTMDSDGQFVAPPNDYGKHYVMPDGVRLATDIEAKPDGGTYVTFNSSGRGEAGQIHLTNSQGKTVTVLCASPTELFHIAQPGEVEP